MERVEPEREIASQRAKSVPEQSVGKIPGILAKLELRELQKSEKPINEDRGIKKKIETIRPWNNYTIVMLEGSPDIRIFDEDMKPVESFKPPLSDKKVSVDWWRDDIKRKIGKKFISQNPRDRGNVLACMFDEVPLELRAFAKKSLEKETNLRFEVSGAQSVEFSASDLTVLSDKYVVLTTKEGAFFAFITKTDKGVTLAPKDWKRLNPSEQIPAELSKGAEKVLGENEGYKSPCLLKLK